MSTDDLLSHIVNAKKRYRLWTFYKSLMARLGFTRATYIYSHFATETSLGNPVDTVRFSTLPSAQKAHTNLIEQNAKALLFAFEQDGPRSWPAIKDSIGQRSDNSDPEMTFAQLTGLGKNAGYVIGFREISTRTRGAVFLSAEDDVAQSELDKVWMKRSIDILLKSNLLHLRMITLPHSPAPGSLTTRQREVLQWVGDGKTIQDIGVLMGLTAGTVEKHLRLARRALSVETTTQAVLKAAMLHLIFVPNL